MRLGICLLFAAASCFGQNAAHSREVFQKVCGTCHAVGIATAARHSRAEWQDEIAKMVTNGAKATDEEFATVLDFLVGNYGPASDAAPAGGRGGRGAAPVMRTGAAGPDDKHVVDPVAADRGRTVWAAECINCHGTNARGTDNGANLVRSVLVLHDRYGSTIGPFLRQGHPMQSGAASASLTEAQIRDLAHFIHQRLYDTLRGSPIFHVHDIMTGDAAAGAAYFNGAGRCNTCHSPTRDLARVATKYDPSTLQGRFLNPRPFGGRGGGRGGRGGGAPPPGPQVTLTVTSTSGESVTGTPVIFDDFNVAVRDAAGDYHSWKRTAAVKVVKHDPYAAHDELLETYTDKNMHDLLAYLETLK